MNIYIYGNHSFKKEIHETLEHSNIKFKLDENSIVKEIDNISELKEAIKNNPNDIYLIDDEKIIKSNSINKKLKFLTPKDGIEEEFLLDNGIADLSIDSLKEIPKYIIKRYEELKKNEIPLVKEEIFQEEFDLNIEEKEKDNILELDDELAKLLASGKEEEENNIDDYVVEDDFDDIFSSAANTNLDRIKSLIGDIDEDEPKEKSQEDDFAEMVDFNDNFGLNNISFDYDDNEIINEKSVTKNENNQIPDDMFSDLDFLQEIGVKDVAFDKFDEITESVYKDNKSSQGDKMSDEFFELDSLNEKDLLEALGSIKSDNRSEITKIIEKSSTNNNETLQINSSNVDDLAQLISRLLSNKTLEITIKIKD